MRYKKNRQESVLAVFRDFLLTNLVVHPSSARGWKIKVEAKKVGACC
jgi:hypothetical protein